MSLIAGAAFFAYWFSLAALVLPTQLVEGPMVQLAGERSLAVVWFTSRPDATQTFEVVVDGQLPRKVPIESDGTRHVARLSGLQPASKYPYTIALPNRVLATATARTSKPAGAAFTMMVFGDSGQGSDEQNRLAARMIEHQPDLIVHTGDLIYPGGERKHFRKRFFEPYGPLIREVNFWPSLGNHDDAKRTRGGPYREVFELPRNGPEKQPPENNYWFEYADARFVVLDSNVSVEVMASDLAPWAERVLGEARTTWKFVVFHHPPYTNGKHKPHQGVRDALVPVFERTGVDVVWNGHDHLYERTVPMRGGAAADGGVVYVVSGAGGAKLYELKADMPSYFASSNDDAHGFTVARVDGRTLNIRQVNIEGKVLDDWTMTKPGVGGASSAPASAVP
ncbi:MAG: metallophosphoesterase [Phycisphaerae bacterium]